MPMACELREGQVLHDAQPLEPFAEGLVPSGRPASPSSGAESASGRKGIGARNGRTWTLAIRTDDNRTPVRLTWLVIVLYSSGMSLGLRSSNRIGVCAHCRVPFAALRSTRRFCSDRCRKQAAKARDIRRRVLASRGNVCQGCGTKKDTGQLFVRGPGNGIIRTFTNCRVLCGRCNSQASRDLFHQNYPTARAGWGHRRAAELRQAGVPPRRRRPRIRLISLDPAVMAQMF